MPPNASVRTARRLLHYPLEAANDLRAIWKRRWAAYLARRQNFGAFGEGSIIEQPFRVVTPSCVHLGRDVRIRPNAWLSVAAPSASTDNRPLLSIGDRATLGADLVIACAASVEIGPDVLASERVFIGDTYHEYRDVTRSVREQGLARGRAVRIGAGAFLGIGSIVLPGVTIGDNACIGAGAVVTRDVPARSVAVGNPARIVSHWDEHVRAWRSGPPGPSPADGHGSGGRARMPPPPSPSRHPVSQRPQLTPTQANQGRRAEPKNDER
jgi:acetyltransferase-like isoleucine patch superfamily enzyme